jgi:hypothetical protein
MVEAWACLVARARLEPCAQRFEQLMAAALHHPLTRGQLARAEAAPRLLPVDFSLGVRHWAWEAVAEQHRRRLAAGAVDVASRSGADFELHAKAALVAA